MKSPKLFMFLLGCKPAGRHTEQHDVFFAIGDTVAGLKEEIINFWPEAKGKIHIDAWREVNALEGYRLKVVSMDEIPAATSNKLFFINLGGYKKGEFDELHYKMLIVADSLAAASKIAKETAFYKHTGFEGAVSHIDDKYGVDVDDVFEIQDVLSARVKCKYRLELLADTTVKADELQLGYLPLTKV